MKTLRLVLILTALAVVPASFTFAATNQVLVVVNGNTQVNRETYNFIRQNFSRNGLDVTVSASTNPSTVKAGDYKAVVVVNTGVTSGVDPVLDRFIKAYPNKKQIFQVNLYAGTSDLTVTPLTAAKNPEGVDGVTAASLWRGAIDMHVQWVGDLIVFVKKA